MKFIFHLGAGKTGSTALQASLDKARDALEADGVWYPRVEDRVTRRQNILATPFQSKLQRVYVGKTFDGLPAAEYAKAAWARIAERARQYDTVIISSEHLGSIHEVERFGAFFKAEFPDADVRAIYYLRRVSKHTASRMQQRIGADHNLKDFRPADSFAIVKAWKGVFPVELREFSPKSLLGGGIASDFSQTVGLKTELPEIRKNEGLSAEAMQILQDYRRKYYSHKPNRFTPDTDALKAVLKKVKSEKGGKAALKEDIADTLDRMEFVYQLKDNYGFEFEGLDYTKGAVPKEALDDVFKGTDVRDYMVFDEERFRELHLEVLHAVLAENHNT